MKISAGTFQHGLGLGAQALGNRAVVCQCKLVKKRVRAQRAHAPAYSKDSSEGFLSLHA